MAAAAVESKPMWLFYHLQGERGESAAHPNAARMSVAGTPTLAHVHRAFPLMGSGNFHFRFQALTPDKQVVFLDRLHPDDEVPTVNGNVIAKVLRLDDLKCTSRTAVALQPRAAAAMSAGPAATQQPAPIRAAAPVASASNPGTPTTAPAVSRGASAAPSGASSSPAAASASSGASPMDTLPGMRPVKKVEIDASVVAPTVVDADLEGKSDYVQAKVMERRNQLKKAQEERLAEAAARDAAQKAEQEEKDVLKGVIGPRLRDWGEEPGGMKKNIRILLSSLHTVLWDEAKWEPVAMAKLIEPKRVKITYMKAITIVHPDKHNHLDNTQKFIATSIFHYLEQAFRDFQEKEM